VSAGQRKKEGELTISMLAKPTRTRFFTADVRFLSYTLKIEEAECSVPFRYAARNEEGTALTQLAPDASSSDHQDRRLPDFLEYLGTQKGLCVRLSRHCMVTQVKGRSKSMIGRRRGYFG
jgi:hypothetical protein